MLFRDCNVLKFKCLFVFAFVWIMLFFLLCINRNHAGIVFAGNVETNGITTIDKSAVTDNHCYDYTNTFTSVFTAQKPLDNYPGKESLKDINICKTESTSSGSSEKKFVNIPNLISMGQPKTAKWSLLSHGIYSCYGIIKMHILRI